MGPAAQALAPAAPALKQRFGGLPEVDLGDAGGAAGPLAAWREVFRVGQMSEVWRELGAWVAAHSPSFGPGTAERFQMAARVTAAEARRALAPRVAVDRDPRITICRVPSTWLSLWLNLLNQFTCGGLSTVHSL